MKGKKNMLNQKLVNAASKFQDYNLEDQMNLINIFQYLSNNFAEDLPLNNKEIEENIFTYLEKLGININNPFIAAKQNYNDPTKNHKLAKYHIAQKCHLIYQNYTINQISFDKHYIKIFIIQNLINENIEYNFELNYDQNLINLFTLLNLSRHNKKVLNKELLSLSAKLIYIQQSSISIKHKDEINLKKVNYNFGHDTTAFLNKFVIPNNSGLDNELPDVTINDLVTYMSDVINDRPVDTSMFNLITKGVPNNNSQQIILNQARQLKLDNILTKVSTKDAIEIKNKLSKNVAKKVKNIWQINNQLNNNQYNANAKHLTLVHGTQNLSVLNILGEGLQDSVTLKKHGSTHYHYTGSGLGEGIYFARLDQADKSYNYTEYNTDDHVSSYMFIADVAYTNCKTVDSYDSSLTINKNQDLVWGKAVGSYDRDEFVAKHTNQIQLKYLLELA